MLTSHPPSTDVDGMDRARCAALHSYLVDYYLAADGVAPATTPPSTYLTTHGDSSSVSSRFHYSVSSGP
ncbi:hypothetical protein CMUS01_14682 [Colletotrichum musicola]|uniref:Uncharacterized protein n=1 Tax=Colletotrichum musicola TaxID=2175873 RepID=A0A8H6MR60_9PEZI|nr:hypothetical protein CMUS01_14682 [Colletotrichum musicola]